MFNISYSPQFNLSVKQKFLFPKVPKNHPKFTENRKTLVNVLSRGIWRCLKRQPRSQETWTRYWWKGHVKRRQNSLQLHARLTFKIPTQGSRIYRLGEKSRVAEGQEPHRGVRACCPENCLTWICAEMQSGAFWDTILRNVTVVFYFFSRDYVLTMLHFAPIFANVNRRVTRLVYFHKYLYTYSLTC